MHKFVLKSYPSDDGTIYNIRMTPATAALSELEAGDADNPPYPKKWKPRRLKLVKGNSKKLVPTINTGSHWNGLLPPLGTWTVVGRIAEKMPK
jgi:hypothetical protein